MPPDQGEVAITDIIGDCDQLADRLERYQQQLEGEHEPAVASGDERRIMRVERGIKCTGELLDVIDDVFERVGALRHNDHQLKWARQGKMV